MPAKEDKMKKAEKTKAAPAAKKISLDGVSEVVKKIPAFIRRMKSELEKLLALLEKAESALQAFEHIKFLTKEQKAQKRMLERQVKAMRAYRDALSARVSFEEARA